jgi:formylglycine-generating enzyme required for sulfatase activity
VANLCNTGSSQFAPWNAFPVQTRWGCFDMVGNAREWTVTLWGRNNLNPDYVYPWVDDERNDPEENAEIFRVLRGGMKKAGSPVVPTCADRYHATPNDRGYGISRPGFRVVELIIKERSVI